MDATRSMLLCWMCNMNLHNRLQNPSCLLGMVQTCSIVSGVTSPSMTATATAKMVMMTHIPILSFCKLQAEPLLLVTVICICWGPGNKGHQQYKVVWLSFTDLHWLQLPSALGQFFPDHFGMVYVRLATECNRHVFTYQCHRALQFGSAIYDLMNDELYLTFSACHTCIKAWGSVWSCSFPTQTFLGSKTRQWSLACTFFYLHII